QSAAGRQKSPPSAEHPTRRTIGGKSGQPRHRTGHKRPRTMAVPRETAPGETAEMETDSGAGCQPQGPTRFTWLSTHTVFPGSDTGRCYLAQLPAVSRATGSTLDKSRFPRTGRASWEHLSFHVQLLGP